MNHRWNGYYQYFLLAFCYERHVYPLFHKCLVFLFRAHCSTRITTRASQIAKRACIINALRNIYQFCAVYANQRESQTIASYMQRNKMAARKFMFFSLNAILDLQLLGIVIELYLLHWLEKISSGLMSLRQELASEISQKLVAMYSYFNPDALLTSAWPWQ